MRIEQIIRGLISGEKWAYNDPNNFAPTQVSSIAEFGTHFYSAEPSDKSLLEVRNWMQYATGLHGRNGVFFDTTTLHTVQRLLINQDGHSLIPATLLDLSSFVNGVVLFNTIIHLENYNLDSFQFNERLDNEPIVISLPIEQLYMSYDDGSMDGVGALLRALWLQTSSYMSDLKNASKRQTIYGEESKAIKDAWRTAFDFNEQDDLWFDPQGEMGNKQYDSDGPGLLQQLVDFSRPDVLRYALQNREHASLMHNIIDESNYRSLFNLGVSNCLGLQYMSNSFRLPFRKFYFDRAKAIQHQLGAIRAIEKEYKDLRNLYFAPDENNLTVPFFLAAILSKISSLDEFFEELAHVRVQAGLFRLHRHELDIALLHGNVAEAKKLSDALRQDADYLRVQFPYASVLGATAAVLAAITANLPPVVLTAVGLLTAASQFPREDIEKLKKRVLQRQYLFLVDQKDAALALTNAYPKIAELWNITETSQSDAAAFAKSFDRLAKLQY